MYKNQKRPFYPLFVAQMNKKCAIKDVYFSFFFANWINMCSFADEKVKINLLTNLKRLNYV